MKLISSVVLIIFFVSCKHEQPKEESIKLYYLSESERMLVSDTLEYEKYKGIDQDDSLLAQRGFTLNEKQHLIKMYTSDFHAQIDGGSLYYVLDSMGIIYLRSTTWRICERLQSNNDSLNDLINAAMAYILLRPELHCYQCKPSVEVVKYVPPVIKDE